jgi:CMP-N-acetylneuraminic acid synthetase
LIVNILGLIPARGGSKAIPRKNIVNLAGKPLLAYTCEAALSSRRLTRLILNTDDQEIAAVGLEYGVEAPFMRPAHLAGDEAPILPVLQHAVQWLAANQGFHTDVLVLLQPTSPLRRAEHIDAAVDLLLGSGADTVVSVQEVPHQYNPVSLMQVGDQGCLEPFMEGEMILRRQDKPRVYARNGPAILALQKQTLDSGRLYGDKVIPYIMGPLESVDIDDQDDLTLVEALIQSQGLNN